MQVHKELELNRLANDRYGVIVAPATNGSDASYLVATNGRALAVARLEPDADDAPVAPFAIDGDLYDRARKTATVKVPATIRVADAALSWIERGGVNASASGHRDRVPPWRDVLPAGLPESKQKTPAGREVRVILGREVLLDLLRALGSPDTVELRIPEPEDHGAYVDRPIAVVTPNPDRYGVVMPTMPPEKGLKQQKP